ncbi:MAG TPA: methyltransferase domain-containing protein [Solirubrobacterales bacterium]|jgi:ubiquinone/menaquinone biosynthesis C-methylase UbiE|nr:methyltransferase domain-containing protein [Solirubrobacterales bacterium]
MSSERYLPALRFPGLTRFFDPFIRLAMPERRFKQRLLEQAAPKPGQRVLDLGCGTGTLAIMVKGAEPAAEVVGLDADPEILERARAKAEGAGVEVQLDRGFSTELPYEEGSFDLVLSTLFFHHLTGADKRRTAEETARVLRAGGEVHVADYGRPADPLMRALVSSVRLVDGLERTRDNVAGALPQIFEQGGLERTTETDRMRTPLGTLALYRARKP